MRRTVRLGRTRDDARRQVLIEEIVGHLLGEPLPFVEMLGTELRERHVKRSMVKAPEERGLKLAGCAAVAQPMRQPDDPDSGPPKSA